MNAGRYILRIALTVTMLAATFCAAQQRDPCPGFKNPTSFCTNDTQYYWIGRVGERVYPTNRYDTTTGTYIMSTCPSAPDIPCEDLLSPNYYSGQALQLENCNETFFDANEKRFQIITPANAGIDQFTVSSTGTGMQRIPEGYTSSIRLGDMRNNGQCSSMYHDHEYDTVRHNRGAEALFYTMYVTSENALLLINYAVVARRYPHTAYDAGEFLIRVVLQNGDGTWPNEAINDYLWYKVSAPNFNNNALPAGWCEGTDDGLWPCKYAYKPWATVAISLSNYLYQNVRIEMYTSDCIYNADPIYAYICGDFQMMSLLTNGCPDPESDVIDTLIAPNGMLSYQWYVTTQGAENDLYNSRHMDSVSFRPLTDTLTDNKFTPMVSDFVLTEGPNAGDTVNKQTYMCVMTSALDPAKPMQSKLYTNVSLQRPLLAHHTESTCDTTVYFYDRSQCLVQGGLNYDSTYWVLYSDTTYTQVIDTLWASDTSFHFQQPGYYGVKQHCMSTYAHCVAEERFSVKASGGDKVDYSLYTTVCEGERINATCTQGCGVERTWYVDGQQSSHDYSLSRLLPTGTHTIRLESIDSGGCITHKDTTVRVLSRHTPTLVSDNTSLCLGDSTVIEAIGEDSYLWLSYPRDNSLPEGYIGPSVTVSPEERTTYTVRSASQYPCHNDNSTIAIEVRKPPVPTVMLNRPVVSVDNNILALTDLSPFHTNTTWSFEDGSVVVGSHHVHDFGYLIGVDSVCASMETCNGPECCSDTSFCIPVKTFNIWFPNAFTPSLESNSRFGAVCNSVPEHYEIWIYNRYGLLVYASTDPAESWDGNNRYGTPCPQGAYVYHYRYATENDGPYHEGTGTVTLIR